MLQQCPEFTERVSIIYFFSIYKEPQNSEQMGEQEVGGGMVALPEPSLICGICSIDREGLSYALHTNYLLPISNNLEQGAGDSYVEGEGPSDKPTPVPHENDALPVDCLTKSQPEGMLNSPSEQCKPFDPGSTGSTSVDPTDEGLQADNYAPVPPR